MKNDYKAVINSLIYDFSNDVIETVVNKLKLIKRIMLGRFSFELFKFKAMRLELMKHIN